MPLLDHFHPPLSKTRHWESFFSQWAGSIANALNALLPNGYFAEAQIHPGPRMEVNEASDGKELDLISTPDASTGSVQNRSDLSPPDLILPITFPPEFAVSVFENSAGPCPGCIC